eukprot:m.124080 g.124080  ORF g.124080 m.124080 type:complete len:149 (-) comp22056_c0_seq2:278-724(-)
MYVSTTGARSDCVVPLAQVRNVHDTGDAALQQQANAAPGIISTDSRRTNGTIHTMSVWENRESMRQYMRKGDHVQAMKIFDSIATGKTYGYETDEIPTVEVARELYDTKGRVMGRAAREKNKNTHGPSEVGGHGSESSYNTYGSPSSN